jgi:glutamate-1-semialdehyde 2,1-aminomutase
MTERRNYSATEAWLSRAKKVIPSASQTYSKSYRYYCEGAAPAFIDRALGSHVWDVDGNEFTDFIMALGPITLGYNDPVVNQAILRQLDKGIIFSMPSTLEVELAERLVRVIPCAEMVRFVKNGSDATASAVRLARAFTGRDLVLACGYHGMQDWYIGSSENNLGVPESVQALIKSFPYNDADALEAVLRQYANQTAAIIMEPVRVEEPAPGYLEAVRELATRYGVLLIFDEVVTGFRLALGGAQAHYGVTPDLSAFGKGIANGMPLSVVAGRADVMRLIDEGAFISLTFGGEALSLAAALATLDELERRDAFRHTWALGEAMTTGMKELVIRHVMGELAEVTGTRIMPALFFKPWNGIPSNDILALFQQEVIARGVLFLGVNYFCASHTIADVQKALDAFDAAFTRLEELRRGRPLSELLIGETYRPVFKRNKH